MVLRHGVPVLLLTLILNLLTDDAAFSAVVAVSAAVSAAALERRTVACDDSIGPPPYQRISDEVQTLKKNCPISWFHYPSSEMIRGRTGLLIWH